MKGKYLKICLLLYGLLQGSAVRAQMSTEEMKIRMGSFLDEVARREVSIGSIRIDSIVREEGSKSRKGEKRTAVYADMNCSYIPFREDNVKEIYEQIRAMLPEQWQGDRVVIITNGRSIEEQIPMALRSNKRRSIPFSDDKKRREKEVRWAPSYEKPLVARTDIPWQAPQGLQGRHIALWQSHGWYFEQKLDRWEWQRARIFETVEDLYTQSYVLPFLVPMLENAGAYVMLPRERDTNPHEVVVDNDTNLSATHQGCSRYSELSGEKGWKQGEGAGFALSLDGYRDFQNPFTMGSYRVVESIRKGEASSAEWIADLPEQGEYAVYVAYRSLPQSSDKVCYTIHHLGGSTTCYVNQKMGGGTWIYLGTFSFAADKSGKVTLTNLSEKAGTLITADAVKFGGGMGNIVRGTSTSGYPRWCEAARYWLQWAGAPDSIYSDSHGGNDYTDDYKSRGKWVNWLAGGSVVNPKEEGLGIPVELAFAFHTDAGTTMNDSIIGTLGIYQTDSYNGIFEGGASRYLSRDMTDLIQSQITHDIRTLLEPRWSRRGMWNKSYYEARVPRVPTMLLELLSHQNLADMRYGLNPYFRFIVSRAIYKGMLRFVASQRNIDYVVQPLPVNSMALTRVGEEEVELTWMPTDDELEPTAKAEGYIVYTRLGDGCFDNGTLVKENRYRTRIPAGVVCSYKVSAVNRGGRSFDSEILSAGRLLESKGTAMVINGFNRVSAPADFRATVCEGKELAGFMDAWDHGVPYIKDISYIGSMKEFRREIPWMDDDASGFGDSYGDCETQVIAGNSFDYPAIHGKALLQAGYSFVSSSSKAVSSGMISLDRFPVVDYILGKQCQTKIGSGKLASIQYKTFDTSMQQVLKDYCLQGGGLLVSGAFVGSDLWDSRVAEPLKEDQQWAMEWLKYKWRVGQAARTGAVKSVSPQVGKPGDTYHYHHELNGSCYVVESPDAIEPASPEAVTILRYNENNLSAGVAYLGEKYRTCILGFPIETLGNEEEIGRLMLHLTRLLNPEKKE